MNAHNSEKLPVTFELRKSGERPAVVRYDGHCLEVYKNRIKYRGKRKYKCKYWKDIIKCDCGTEERCETFASVPLTRTKELKRCNGRIGNFDRCGHIHFWITCNRETMGHFYVSSTGVAWVGKNCADPETKSWAELDEWM